MNYRELQRQLKTVYKPANDESEICERCRRTPGDVGIHPFWPTWLICGRCVRVLLEIKAKPFILRPGTYDDYYVCADEKEWNEIKSGRKSIPSVDSLGAS
jgi:hypothetical protein